MQRVKCPCGRVKYEGVDKCQVCGRLSNSFEHAIDEPLNHHGTECDCCPKNKPIALYSASQAVITGSLITSIPNFTGNGKNLTTTPISKADSRGKARLGWKYWPTVYYWEVVNTIRAAWKNMWLMECLECDGKGRVEASNHRIGKVECPECNGRGVV